MPQNCAAIDCPKMTYKFRRSFHKFPQDPDMRRKWLEAMRRPDFEVNKYSNICHVHFHLDDIYMNTDRIQLKHNAIPCRFHFPDTGWILSWDREAKGPIGPERFEALMTSTEPPDPALAGLPGLEDILPAPPKPATFEPRPVPPPIAKRVKPEEVKESKPRPLPTRSMDRPTRKRVRPKKYEDTTDLEEEKEEEEDISGASNSEPDYAEEEPELVEDEEIVPKKRTRSATAKPGLRSAKANEGLPQYWKKTLRDLGIDGNDANPAPESLPDLVKDFQTQMSGAAKPAPNMVLPKCKWNPIFENTKYVIHKGVPLDLKAE